MALFKTRSAAVYGIDAHLIDVEVDMYKSGAARDFITVEKSLGSKRLQSQKERPVAEHSYTVLYEPAEEGGYVAFVPALPGLVTEGDTYEQTRDRVKEAIEGYLESLLKDGQPIPPDAKITLEPVKEKIRIAIPEPA